MSTNKDRISALEHAVRHLTSRLVMLEAAERDRNAPFRGVDRTEKTPPFKGTDARSQNTAPVGHAVMKP